MYYSAGVGRHTERLADQKKKKKKKVEKHFLPVIVLCFFVIQNSHLFVWTLYLIMAVCRLYSHSAPKHCSLFAEIF